ncbi:hypothetical protein Nmel_002869 [Mimus melanotis]
MVFLPDESRSLPPPPLLNKGSLWFGAAGWLAALLDNAFNQRPILRAGAFTGRCCSLPWAALLATSL